MELVYLLGIKKAQEKLGPLIKNINLDYFASNFNEFLRKVSKVIE